MAENQAPVRNAVPVMNRSSKGHASVRLAAYQAASKSGGHKYHALGGQRLSGWIAAGDSQRQLADAGRDAGACAAGVTRCPAVVGGGDSGRELWSVGGAASPGSRGDRKSTRLNSSH